MLSKLSKPGMHVHASSLQFCPSGDIEPTLTDSHLQGAPRFSANEAVVEQSAMCLRALHVGTQDRCLFSRTSLLFSLWRAIPYHVQSEICMYTDSKEPRPWNMLFPSSPGSIVLSLHSSMSQALHTTPTFWELSRSRHARRHVYPSCRLATLALWHLCVSEV